MSQLEGHHAAGDMEQQPQHKGAMTEGSEVEGVLECHKDESERAGTAARAPARKWPPEDSPPKCTRAN